MRVIKRVVLSLFFGAKIFASAWDLLENDEDLETSSVVPSSEIIAYTSEAEVFKIQSQFVPEKDTHHHLGYNFVMMSILPYIGAQKDIKSFIAAISSIFYHNENRTLYREALRKALLGHNDFRASHQLIFRALQSIDYFPLSNLRREEFFRRFPAKIEGGMQDLDVFIENSVRGRGRFFEEIIKTLSVHGAKKMLLNLLQDTHVSQDEKRQYLENHLLNIDLIRFLGLEYLIKYAPFEIRKEIIRKYYALDQLIDMSPLERGNFLNNLPEKNKDDQDLKVVVYLAVAKAEYILKDERLKTANFLLENFKDQYDDQIIEAYQSIAMSQNIPGIDRLKAAKILRNNYKQQYAEQIIKTFSSIAKDPTIYDNLRLKASKLLHELFYGREDDEIIKAYLFIARDQSVLTEKRLESLEFLLKTYKEKTDHHIQEIALSMLRHKKLSMHRKSKITEFVVLNYPKIIRKRN